MNVPHWDDSPPSSCDAPESHPDGCACVRPGEERPAERLTQRLRSEIASLPRCDVDRGHWQRVEDATMDGCWRDLQELAEEYGSNPRFLGLLLRLAAERARFEGITVSALRARLDAAVWVDAELDRLSRFEGPRLMDGSYFSGGDLHVEDLRW